VRPLFCLLLLLCARAVAAPPLAVPDAPPGMAACGPGWQPARQLAALDRGAGFLVESSYAQDGWRGRLEQRALATGIGGALSIGATPIWEAGALLTGDPANALPAHPAPQERKIYTLVRRPGVSDSSAVFEWSSLGSEERAWLDLAPSSGAADGLGEARVAWMRGDRTREAGQPDGVFRRRASLLGDTIRSTPLLVRAPSATMRGPGYAAFHARYKERASAIYLGANDGMLHAFDARDGTELFAYIPRALLPALNLLTDPAYVHRAWVDASAGQGEASIGGQWRSVLVSGMGMGARGVFALDVTDPAAFGAGMGALWEFTEQDDPAIGHVGTAPLIARLKVAVTGGAAQYRDFALVASGINNYGQDAAHADPGGALFLLALDKPASARWKEGDNYYRLAAPASDPALANALAAPSIVTAADGSARYAYAGDLQGTLWRFDFTGKPPFSSAALFEARDAGGRRQPITQPARVVFAPGGGYLVLFGTGKLIEESDLLPAGFTSQSFYAVRDSGASPPVKVKGRAELERRILSGQAGFTLDGAEFDYTGPDAKKGWYFDFPRPGDGERLAAAPVLASGAVLVNTIVPGSDPCAPSPRTYVLDALAGLAFKADGKPASGALAGEQGRPAAGALPIVLEMGVVTGPRGATGGTRATRKIGIVHLQGKAGAADVRQVEVSLPARRISWREVANWQELHDAAKKSK
jgi:type IV pilus assembly protein PilY1